MGSTSPPVNLAFTSSGQTAHVVVGFDDRAAFDRAGFNDVRIDGSLGEEGDPLEFLGLIGKAADKFVPDDFALCFRIGYAGNLLQETLPCIHNDQIDGN